MDTDRKRIESSRGIPGKTLTKRPHDMFDVWVVLRGKLRRKNVLLDIYEQVRQTETIIKELPEQNTTGFRFYCTPKALKDIKEFIDKKKLWKKIFIGFNREIEGEKGVIFIRPTEYGRLEKIGTKEIILEDAFYVGEPGIPVSKFKKLAKKVGRLVIPIDEIIIKNVISTRLSGQPSLFKSDTSAHIFIITIPKEHIDKVDIVKKILLYLDATVDDEKKTATGGSVVSGTCNKGVIEQITDGLKEEGLLEVVKLEHRKTSMWSKSQRMAEKLMQP